MYCTRTARAVLANVNRELPLRWGEEQLRVIKQADSTHGVGATAAAVAPRRDPPTAVAGSRAAANATAAAHHAAAISKEYAGSGPT